MPRRIVSVVAVALGLLIAGSALLPGSPARAFQATPAASTPCPSTTAEENEALVLRLYDEGWNQGHVEVLDEVLADDYAHHVVNTSVYLPVGQVPAPAQDDLAKSILEFRTDFPDLHFTIQDVVATADDVAVRMVVTGTQADALDAWDAPMTGRTMERPTWAFYHVMCGKINEGWALPDNLTMLRQLGIITDDELIDAGTPTVATPVP
jgi:steroid delta-isomerase-like uncharacterized protein